MPINPARKMNKDYFIFYRSFYEAIKVLPRDIQVEIYTAIMEYGLYGNETENLKPVARSLFTLMRPVMEANNVRYENGKKGGSRRKVEMADVSGSEPKDNQDGTKAEPKDNQTATKREPNGNQTATKAEPNGNQDGTKAEPYIENKDKENKDNKENPSNEGSKKAGLSSRLNYEKLKDIYNEKLGRKLSTIDKMTEKRKQAIKARVSEYSWEDVLKVFDNVLKSPFLLGHNDRNWRADFDWIFCPSNFTKIIEGKYEAKGAPFMPGQKLHTDDDDKIIKKLGF